MAEINRTVLENNIPIGSIIILKIMGVDCMFIIVHSRRVVVLDDTVVHVGIIIAIRIIHVIVRAVEKIENLFDIVFIALYGYSLMLLYRFGSGFVRKTGRIHTFRAHTPPTAPYLYLGGLAQHIKNTIIGEIAHNLT